MKKLLLTFFLSINMLFAASIEDDFIKSLRTAIAEQDVQKFTELVEFASDTPDWLKSQSTEAFMEATRLQVDAIEIIELTGRERTKYTVRDVEIEATLTPTKRVKITFDEKSQGKAKVTATTFILGEKEGKYKIVSGRPTKKEN